jgi:hypothetical protein
MSKKLLLTLPDDVHEAVKNVQIDRLHQTRERINLNELLVDIIRTSKPVNAAAFAILERAALKKKAT